MNVSGGTTGLTFSGGPVTASGTITMAGTLGVANGGTGTATALTAGSVVFAGASGVYSQDNANLFWDDANNRLGIGTSAPTTQLDIHGSGNLALRRNSTDSVPQILLSQAGTGDSVLDFLLVGTRAWRMGIDNSDADKFKLQPSQTSDFSGAVVTVDVNGNVGIGTSSPSSRLHVAGALTLDTALSVANGGTGATTLTGVVIGNGTSAFTVKTNPTGAFVGTTDTQTLSNKTIERAILNDGYTEEVFAITDGGTVNLDPNNGSIQTWTLGANRTPGQANWAAGQSITLMINDSASSFTVTWTTLGVVWVGGSAPSLAPASGFTIITLWKVGTTIYGALTGQVV